MLREHAHPEPWIIPLFDPPTKWRAYGFGLRWGTGTSSFTTLPRSITNSTGWFHSWDKTSKHSDLYFQL